MNKEFEQRYRKVIDEWNALWAPIDEEISKHPDLKLGESKALKVRDLISQLAAAQRRVKKHDEALERIQWLTGALESARLEIKRLQVSPNGHQIEAFAQTAKYNLALAQQLSHKEAHIVVRTSHKMTGPMSSEILFVIENRSHTKVNLTDEKGQKVRLANGDTCTIVKPIELEMP